MQREGWGVSQEEAIAALLGKFGASVHEVVEGILVPVIIIPQQRLIPFLHHTMFPASGALTSGEHLQEGSQGKT